MFSFPLDLETVTPARQAPRGGRSHASSRMQNQWSLVSPYNKKAVNFRGCSRLPLENLINALVSGDGQRTNQAACSRPAPIPAVISLEPRRHYAVPLQKPISITRADDQQPVISQRRLATALHTTACDRRTQGCTEALTDVSKTRQIRMENQKHRGVIMS